MSNENTRELDWIIRDKYHGQVPDNESLSNDVDRIKNGEPIDYIIGWKPFFGLKIDLSRRPLIPRTETEYWLEEVMVGLDINKEYSVLDMCAGSGCIGLSFLSRYLKSKCLFIDIDPEMESQINLNAKINSIQDNRYKVVISDLWQSIPTDAKFDIIFCNPPYVDDQRILDRSVADFEPNIALFSGNRGLDHISRFLQNLSRHLNVDGRAYLEFDDGQEDEIAKICTNNNLKAKFHRDQFGLYRYAYIHA